MNVALAVPAQLSPWRRALPALGLALLAVLVLYRETFWSMVLIWSRSDTFAHAFLVPPISLWLAWRQRHALRAVVPRAEPWCVPVALVLAAAWLVGDLAGLNTVTQLAATLLLIATVPAMLGLPVAYRLLFPLAFLCFMVPLGEFAIPVLMQWTADFTVAALRLLGVPVFREGLSFVIPSGTWSVVEACSGVRYLIASFMVGTLFAYLQYRSPLRRVLFGVVSLLVPVLANWIRAVLIVLLGHWSGNKIATGADHLIYGWVFFGLVVGLMFWVGARWTEPEAAAPTPGGAAVRAQDMGAMPGPAWNWMVGAALVVAVALPVAASWRVRSEPLALPVVALPDLAGTTSSDQARPLHAPHFEGARAEASRVYGDGSAAVTVHVAYYRHQTYGHKLASSENVIVRTDDKAWRLAGEGLRPVAVGGSPVMFRSAEIRRGALGSQDEGSERLSALQIMWVAGSFTTSRETVALYSVIHELSGQGDDAAAITFYVRGDDPAQAARVLDGFVSTHLDELRRWLTGLAASR